MVRPPVPSREKTMLVTQHRWKKTRHRAEWPKEAEKFLKQSSYIDSTSETVLDFVRGITNDRQREVPIYLAAKEIIRHAVTHFFDVNGGRHSSLSISGNGTVIRNGQGSRGDMTCLAVGCLRAAGIPARPVLGLGEVWNNAEAMFEKRPILWGEFYLPGCGWIFFDPFKMRGTGIKWKSLDVPWEWFGTENDHAERTPLAYRSHLGCHTLRSPHAARADGAALHACLHRAGQ